MSVLGAAAAFSSGFVKEMVAYHWPANFATFSALAILVAALMVGRREARLAV